MHYAAFRLGLQSWPAYPLMGLRITGLVAAVERLPAIHYSVDSIFWSFGIMGFIWKL